VAKPKREEEKILPFDDGYEERKTGPASSAGGDSDPLDPPAGGQTALTVELSKLRAEKEDLLQTLVRRQADFENFRKRTERDRTEEGRRGVERMILDLIPVLDAFDRALHAHEDPAYEEYRKGVTLIRKQLWDALARHGLQRMDASDKMFDPNVHQAIERVESIEYPDGFIVDVLQDGYIFHGRVLRPAIVRVAVHPDEASGSEATEDLEN
jgi:molecular chaperone GrpE